MKLLPVLIVGLILGLAGGLVYTWVITPVEYINTYPPFMNTIYRKDWVRMAAMAYAVEGNLDRTHLRLSGLPEEEIRFTLLETLEEAAAKNYTIESLKPLAQLAAEYGVDSPVVRVYTQQEIIPPQTVQAERTPTPTVRPPTATPTLTFTPTPVTLSNDSTSPVGPAAFTIISQTLICSDVPTLAISLELTSTLGIAYAMDISRTLAISLTTNLTQTTAVTSALALTSTLDITSTFNLSHTLALTQPLDMGNEVLPVHATNRGREIWLMWDDGADRAFTGFRPEYGFGYADFVVVPGRTYNLYIDNPWGVPLLVLQVEPCTPEEGEGWISRKLVVVEGLK